MLLVGPVCAECAALEHLILGSVGGGATRVLRKSAPFRIRDVVCVKILGEALGH